MTQFFKKLFKFLRKKKEDPVSLGARWEVISTNQRTFSQALANAHSTAKVDLKEFRGTSEKGRVHIYNIGESDYVIKGHPIVKNLKVVGVKPKEPYTLVTSLPMVVSQPNYNVDQDVTLASYTDGRSVAMDLIDSDNLGLDQDAVILSRTSMGVNYGAKGLFWSENNPPLKKEVTAAKKRLNKYHRNILDRVATVQAVMHYDALVACVHAQVSSDDYTAAKKTQENSE